MAERATKGERVRVIAEYWRDETLKHEETRLMAHPLALILAALDGETDPRQLGIPPDEYERRLAALAAQPVPDSPDERD